MVQCVDEIVSSRKTVRPRPMLWRKMTRPPFLAGALSLALWYGPLLRSDRCRKSRTRVRIPDCDEDVPGARRRIRDTAQLVVSGLKRVATGVFLAGYVGWNRALDVDVAVTGTTGESDRQVRSARRHRDVVQQAGIPLDGAARHIGCRHSAGESDSQDLENGNTRGALLGTLAGRDGCCARSDSGYQAGVGNRGNACIAGRPGYGHWVSVQRRFQLLQRSLVDTRE